MTTDQDSERPVSPAPGPPPALAPARPGLAPMLEARSIALVGASPRPGTFGERMVAEVTSSPSRPEVHLVNPRHAEIDGRRCVPSLADLDGPVDLVLLAVPDAALEQQLTLAARRGDRSAVIFGNAHEDPGSRPAGGPGLRERLAAIARPAGMQLCGAGCMGFVNVTRGLRAIGYTEPDSLPAGSVALVTHSGSVFSAMLRVRRAIGYTLAISSGQELVTTAASYLDYALELPETRVLALVLEAIREPGRLRQVLARAAERSLPVVLLTAGGSASGRVMVAAHSGALAADDGGWEALARAYGVHRVGDLAELTDALELFAIGRRAPRVLPEPAAGIATVHDSGLERAHVADLAEDVGVPFAVISETTKARLAGILDPGLIPANPLDVWGTGAGTRELFAGSLLALADDPSVAAVALAVDLISELDGDESYPLAVLDAAAQTTKPLVVLGNLASAVDLDLATRLRQHGIPVLESMRTGLLALRHLLDHARRAPGDGPAGPAATAGSGGASARRDRGAALLAAGVTGGAPLLELLGEYGIATAAAREAADADGALAAAESIGYPVVLKTADPAVSHKSDVGGVVLGLRGPAELARAYADLSARLGPRVLVGQSVPAGPELALGIARDPDLGPLIVVGAGGVLVELLADRAVALPPVDERTARQMIAGLRVARLLAGVRGAPPADLDAVIRAVTALSELACDLGDELEALDVNPLICGPHGAVAVDALAIRRSRKACGASRGSARFPPSRAGTWPRRRGRCPAGFRRPGSRSSGRTRCARTRWSPASSRTGPGCTPRSRSPARRPATGCGRRSASARRSPPPAGPSPRARRSRHRPGTAWRRSSALSFQEMVSLPGAWGACTGNGSAIGSVASRLLPSSSNRSKPSEAVSTTSDRPVRATSAAARATAGPHIIPAPPAAARVSPFRTPSRVSAGPMIGRWSGV
jgi:acetate---CoA ligase (ADP-forming)